LKAFSRFLRRWLPVVIWAVVVLYASTNAGSTAKTASFLRPILMWFFPDLPPIDLREVNFLVRKTAHILQFFIFALLLWRAARVEPPLRIGDRLLVAWVVGISGVVAGLSEGIQIFSRFRGASLGDFLLDMTGVMLALMLVFLTKKLTRDPEQPVA